jgi:hypothetical protein
VNLFAGLESFKTSVDFVPVDNVPPGSEIFWTAVVVFQIVGVLPNVVAEDGEMALRNRAVLIGRGHDVHVSTWLASEPDPSGAELLDAGFVELGLEIFEVTESFGDGLGDRARGIATAFGLHDLPEHGVVDVAAAVVADCGANVFGDGVEIADQFFRSLLGQLGMFFEGCVEILDVGTVMHVVVQGHRLLVDDGFERRVIVGQGR